MLTLWTDSKRRAVENLRNEVEEVKKENANLTLKLKEAEEKIKILEGKLENKLMTRPYTTIAGDTENHLDELDDTWLSEALEDIEKPSEVKAVTVQRKKKQLQFNAAHLHGEHRTGKPRNTVAPLAGEKVTKLRVAGAAAPKAGRGPGELLYATKQPVQHRGTGTGINI